MAKKPYYITTAIAYTSGKPHIGNTYEIVLADSIARFKRAQGYDVRFQTGTDEHGQKVEIKAAEAGVTPKAYVDGVAGEIKRIWDLMDTSYDRFIRTTRRRFRKFLRSSMIRAIFIKAIMKGSIVRRANPFSQRASWWTVNVRTAAARLSTRRKRLISLK